MTTISERLRNHGRGEDWSDFDDKMTEAADTIDALVAALGPFARMRNRYEQMFGIPDPETKNARAALALARGGK